MGGNGSFERNVFINCPFDTSYRRLLYPLLFTILDTGFEPRIALEENDSGQQRLDRILGLVAASRFAVHDLSRLKSTQADEFYRLNMPFELGLDIGCRVYGSGAASSKRCLILESDAHRYRAALSDISGFDIEAHGDRPSDVVSIIRNWLDHQEPRGLPGASLIWGRFNDFMADHDVLLRAKGFSRRDIGRLTIPELMRGMRRWIGGSTDAAPG